MPSATSPDRHLDALDALNATSDRVVEQDAGEHTLPGSDRGHVPAGQDRSTAVAIRGTWRLSCWMTHFAGVRWACDPEHIASRIVENRRVMDHWRRVLPVPIFELEYEAMVADLEGVSRPLVAWCGLDWDPGLPRLPQDPPSR